MSFTMNQSMYSYLRTLSIGERVRFFRQLRMTTDRDTYTISKIAKQMNMAPQTISCIERNESKNPSFIVMCKIAKYLDIPIAYFSNEYYEESLSFEEESV